MSSLTVPELALWQRGGLGFTLLDVRRAGKRAEEGDEIAGTRWLDPAGWLDWKDEVPKDRPAVLYCAFGHEISQGLVAALRALGVDARHLDGGIEAWRRAGQAVQSIDSRAR
jgi:thiosulfate sulfurtransferase